MKWATVLDQMNHGIDFLLLLAEEVNCQVDPDLTFSRLHAGVPGTGNVIFEGKARKGWVRYLDDATVEITFPRNQYYRKVHLDNPKSFEFLEAVFNDEQLPGNNDVQ